MKNVKVLIAFVAGVMIYAFLIHNSSCTRENSIATIEPPDFTYGDETVKMSEGWNFDKTHSSVLWETDYLGVSALLTGRFNTFVAQNVEFDENNPETSTFSGFVVLSTVNTGEPGRDQGCLLNTFGVAVSDTARLTSKKIELDGTGGYIATAELDFHGVKKDVTMKVNYSGISHIAATNPYSVAGLSGQFEFNAKSDFLIESSSIADRVVIKLNLQFKKPD